MKNILIIAASYRKNGNSAALASEFARGAKEAGHAVETVYLADLEYGFCKGCFSCQTAHRCVMQDDSVALVEKMKNADVIVLATPVYYYSISGQLKTLFDRANPLYYVDYKFRDVYALISATEDESYTMEGAVKAIEGWTDCFDHVRFAGVVFAGGVTDVGDIEGHRALNDAYLCGKLLA